MSRRKLPLLIEVWKIAKVLGWTTEVTRDRFVRAGIALKIPGARDWYIIGVKFETTMPALVDPLLNMLESGGLLRTRGNRKAKAG
jgi:hypothetical protein